MEEPDFSFYIQEQEQLNIMHMLSSPGKGPASLYVEKTVAPKRFCTNSTKSILNIQHLQNALSRVELGPVPDIYNLIFSCLVLNNKRSENIINPKMNGEYFLEKKNTKKWKDRRKEKERSKRKGECLVTY